MLKGEKTIILGRVELPALVTAWGNKFFADIREKMDVKLQAFGMPWTDEVYMLPGEYSQYLGISVAIVSDADSEEQVKLLSGKCKEMFEHFANKGFRCDQWGVLDALEAGNPDWFEYWAYECHIHAEPDSTIAYLPYQLILPIIAEELGVDFQINYVRSIGMDNIFILSEGKLDDQPMPDEAESVADEMIRANKSRAARFIKKKCKEDIRCRRRKLDII